MQNEIITDKRNSELLSLILCSDINIADLINRTFDESLLAQDIHHKTFLKTIEQLNMGIPYFINGKSKHVNLLRGLARRMSTEVELHAYYIDYSLSDNDIAIIKGYALLACCYIFNSMNKRLLNEAISCGGRDCTPYRRYCVNKAKEELCEKMTNQSFRFALQSIVDEAHDEFRYSVDLPNKTGSSHFKIHRYEPHPYEHIARTLEVTQY